MFGMVKEWMSSLQLAGGGCGDGMGEERIRESERQKDSCWQVCQL